MPYTLELIFGRLHLRSSKVDSYIFNEVEGHEDCSAL